MSETKNKYDVAIENLLAAKDFREAVNDAWNYPSSEISGCLFSFVSPDGRAGNDYKYGCLTQIKATIRIACTRELTETIRKDERIPDCLSGITPETLPVFKEWQERIDKELGRE